MNIKKVQRTERIEFLLSKEEKDLIFAYAKHQNMSVSKLIRDLVLFMASKPDKKR